MIVYLFLLLITGLVEWAPTPIPRRTNRLHLKPYWLGDSKWAIGKAGRRGRRGGSADIDLNAIPLVDGAVFMHWLSLRLGGWLYIQEGRKRRALTEAELDRPVTEWRRADIVRLRQTKRRGLSRRSRVRPLIYVEGLDLCKKAGARPNIEVKARFGPERAKTMHKQADDREVTAYWMTLVHQGLKAPRPGYSMAEAGEKLADFHAVGAQTALLAHDYPKPADLEQWEPVIDRVWGRWAA